MRLVLYTALIACSALAGKVSATTPKLDPVTCADLRIEQQKGIEAGLAGDIGKGPEWGKSNLNQERLRQIELFIAVDEQVKFGCRDAKITEEARAAAEAARRLELNPDADPLAPAKDPADVDDRGSDGVTDNEGPQKKANAPDDPPKRKSEKKSSASQVKTTKSGSAAAGSKVKPNDAVTSASDKAASPPAASQPPAAP